MSSNHPLIKKPIPRDYVTFETKQNSSDTFFSTVNSNRVIQVCTLNCDRLSNYSRTSLDAPKQDRKNQWLCQYPHHAWTLNSSCWELLVSNDRGLNVVTTSEVLLCFNGTFMVTRSRYRKGIGPVRKNSVVPGAGDSRAFLQGAPCPITTTLGGGGRFMTTLPPVTSRFESELMQPVKAT